eukprot:6179409-Pleurochrysis_carterae.AAC.4
MCKQQRAGKQLKFCTVQENMTIDLRALGVDMFQDKVAFSANAAQILSIVKQCAYGLSSSDNPLSLRVFHSVRENKIG